MAGRHGFPKGYGNKRESSGEQNCYGVWLGQRKNFFISQGLDFWACGLPPYTNASMAGINSFFWNLKEQTYLVSPFHRTKSTYLTDEKQTPITDATEKFRSHIYHLQPNSILWIQPIISDNFVNIANAKNKDHRHLPSTVK